HAKRRCRHNNVNNSSVHRRPVLRKTGTGIKVLNGPKYKQSWKLMLKSCGHFMKWKELAENRTLLVMTRRTTNTFSMIVPRKVLKDAEVFVTTVQRWNQGKKINRQTTPLTSRPPWGLSF